MSEETTPGGTPERKRKHQRHRNQDSIEDANEFWTPYSNFSDINYPQLAFDPENKDKNDSSYSSGIIAQGSGAMAYGKVISSGYITASTSGSFAIGCAMGGPTGKPTNFQPKEIESKTFFIPQKVVDALEQPHRDFVKNILGISKTISPDNYPNISTSGRGQDRSPVLPQYGPKPLPKKGKTSRLASYAVTKIKDTDNRTLGSLAFYITVGILAVVAMVALLAAL